MPVERFHIHIPQEHLDDLRERLANTRWPSQPEETDWDKGTQQSYLRSLVDYWKTEFDWRHQEEELNRFAHYRCEIDGINLHFIHERGKGPCPLPLILTHGWPDSLLRYQKIIPLLADPARYGGDPADAFDVIVPSLPGFGFSGHARDSGINNARVAELWHTLMAGHLGYSRYAAAGGDIGSGVTRYLAQNVPERLVGIHLTDIGIIRGLLSGADTRHLTEEEQRYRQAVPDWISREGAYMSLQASKPRTLAYALNDSPVGLASWIIEKFRSWSDCTGDVDRRFSKDELLTNITLYWLTGTIGSAANMYYENAHSLPPLNRIDVPTGLACFHADILPPPRSWAEKNLNIIRWTDIPHGGHFTAMEEPELFVEDIRAFYRPLRTN